jgi:transcriptional regulator GlxA family with amidase domain
MQNKSRSGSQDVNTLAKAVAMSPRTFARQFDVHFQTTPARWVQSLRVEAACAYLEAQELPLKAISRITGFHDEQSLRRAFVKQLSMTPKEYRERSSSKFVNNFLWRRNSRNLHAYTRNAALFGSRNVKAS